MSYIPNNSQLPPSPSPKLIFLIGMPAAGKTYWGANVAKEHDLDFIDLDIFVTQQEKASVPALFAQYGEKGFRERENKHLKKLVSALDADTVVACGGGTPCFHDNMDVMKSAGIVIYLDADIPTLLEHLRDSTEARPLLNNRGDLAVYLKDMLQKRKGFYEQAHHILQVEDISLATFAKIIRNV